MVFLRPLWLTTELGGEFHVEVDYNHSLLYYERLATGRSSVRVDSEYHPFARHDYLPSTKNVLNFRFLTVYGNGS